MDNYDNCLFNSLFKKEYPIEEVSKNCLKKDPFDLINKIYFKLFKGKIYVSNQYENLPRDKKISISRNALNFYNSAGVIIPPNTIFKDIYLVPPGFKYSLTKRDFYLVSKLKVNTYDSIEKLFSIINSQYSFENSNLLMSGGADSSLLLLLLKKHNCDSRINSFIFKSGEINNDLKRARKLCEFLNSNLVEIDPKEVESKEVENFIINQTKKLKEPIYEPLLYTFSSILEEIKDSKIIFDGQGADTLLGLGHHFLGELYVNKFIRFFSRIGLLKIFQNFVNKFKYKNRIFYRLFKLTRSLNENSLAECLISSLFSINQIFKINNFTKINIDIFNIYLKNYDELSTISLFFLSIISVRELQKYKLDSRYKYCLPFLEKDYIRYCLSLPKRYKCMGNKRKIQIINYLNNHLPFSYLSSQQLPFVPDSSHVLNNVRDKFNDPLINSKNIRRISIQTLRNLLV